MSPNNLWLGRSSFDHGFLHYPCVNSNTVYFGDIFLFLCTLIIISFFKILAGDFERDARLVLDYKTRSENGIMNFPLPQKYIMILPQRSLNCLYAPDKANL
jgi:hypothetical protein